jgi:putative MATE family efflux protein
LVEDTLSRENTGTQVKDHENIHRLRTGSIGRLLAQYSIPAIIASTTASLYNIIDRIFVGHGVGPMAIAGLALTLPLMNMASAFGALVGVGGGALISIRLGERKPAEAAEILGNTLFLNLAFGIGYSIACLAMLKPLLLLIGASPETLPYAWQFMRIILIGNVFTHLYLGLNNATRASGYPRGAMANTMLTVAVNCVLCFLFIFVFHWGIRGAAFATVLAQTSGAVFAFPHFLRKKSAVRFYRHCLRPKLTIIRGIVSIGMSNFAMMLCASMTAALFNVRMYRYGGDYAIGAFGIVNTLAMFFVMVSMGVNQGMQPIAGYNFGARQLHRVKAVFRSAIIGTTCGLIGGFLLAEIFPRAVAAAFTRDAQLIAQTVVGMRLFVIMYPLNGFQMTTSTFFQAIGKARISLLLALSRQVLFLVPALIILPLVWGLTGAWLAGPAADLAAFVTTILLLKTLFRRSLSA